MTRYRLDVEINGYVRALARNIQNTLIRQWAFKDIREVKINSKGDLMISAYGEDETENIHSVVRFLQNDVAEANAGGNLEMRVHITFIEQAPVETSEFKVKDGNKFWEGWT